MTQALTVSVEKNPFLDGKIPFRLTLDWTAAVAGTVSLAVASTYTTQLAKLSACPIYRDRVQGKLRSIETIPGASGDLATNLPTAYDLTILDAYGYDILAGSCLGRSASVAEKVVPAGTVIIDSELTLTISSAGSGAQGRIIMEFEDLGDAKL